MQTVAADGRPQKRDALQHAFATCIAKTRTNVARLADEPKSGAYAGDGDYFGFGEGFFDIGNWTSSFFTGMALLAYEETKDLTFLREANRLAGVYSLKVGERAADTMHDLGFLYSLYSVGIYKLTGSLEQRAIALKAADELAKRFRVVGGYIQSWGRMDDPESEHVGLAIIDCLMNLPLLFWATETTGNTFHSDIAVTHADTVLRHFIRHDGSLCHGFRFDPLTGSPLREERHSDGSDSYWARGAAWAIYGFALAYRYTRCERYIDAARNIAASFLDELDSTAIPAWDFRAQKFGTVIRDTSAAAIAACGFQEICEHTPGSERLARAATDMIDVLCAEYINHDPACPGVVRHAQVGDGNGGVKNVYASWGDYFLMEALSRRLRGRKSYW